MVSNAAIKSYMICFLPENFGATFLFICLPTFDSFVLCFTEAG